MRIVLITLFSVLISATLIGGGAYFFLKSPPLQKKEVQPAALATSVSVAYAIPALTKQFSNEKYKFSFSLPEGFSARQSVGEDGFSDILVLENAAHEGLQISISPSDEDIAALTAQRVHEDIPDLVITDPQPVEVGAYHTGLAFKSNNEAWNGASREVWFVFRGNLYQISTYEKLDPLLKAIFATWKFF